MYYKTIRVLAFALFAFYGTVLLCNYLLPKYYDMIGLPLGFYFMYLVLVKSIKE